MAGLLKNLGVVESLTRSVSPKFRTDTSEKYSFLRCFLAAIGLIGMVVVFAGVMLCLRLIPEPISVVIGLLALSLWFVAGLFGRVILYAATGRWLQRNYFPIAKHSEAVALLLGTSFWVLLTSLPYVWPFMAAFILIISFGLALTARYRVGWNPSQA